MEVCQLCNPGHRVNQQLHWYHGKNQKPVGLGFNLKTKSWFPVLFPVLKIRPSLVLGNLDQNWQLTTAG
jgi:hypothetical protein